MNFFQGDRQAVVRERDRGTIDNRQRAVRVARRPLEVFLRRVCLVSDTEIARMNETYRKKKGPTDVLSFPTVTRRRPVRLRHGSRTVEVGANLGDIAISPATARRYAKKYGRKFSSELRVLILHGVLHLLGYDHETDRGEMDRVERKLRKRLGLT